MEDILNEPLDWLDEVIEGYGRAKTALIPVLQSVQHKFNYLPEHVVMHVSEMMDLPLSHIYGVATFYAQFSTSPKGRWICQVCDGTACHVRGAMDLIKRIRKDYGLTVENNTSEDMFLTLEIVACIGACALAPAVILNGRVIGHLNADTMAKVLVDAHVSEEEKAGEVQ